MLYFSIEILVVSAKSNPGCEAGSGRTVSWSDRSRIVNDVAAVFGDVSALESLAGAVCGDVGG